LRRCAIITFPAEKLVDNVIRKAQLGTIVLIHDVGGNHPATVQALPGIIAKLKELGYKFVTVSELLAMKEIEQSGIMVKTQ
jgi:peptidoglycan-N-acetylglucosamine deacetylase